MSKADDSGPPERIWVGVVYNPAGDDFGVVGGPKQSEDFNVEYVRADLARTPSTSPPAVDSQTVAFDALVEAVQFVKRFLDNLEDGTDADDPLLPLRRRTHAPLHAKLDAALGRVREWKEQK